MPELPEVQTVVNELNETVSGKVLGSFDVYYPKALQGNIDLLIGLRIATVTRRAKYLVFHFQGSALTLVAHLRMTGKFLFDLTEKDEKHLVVSFRFSDHTQLFYSDVRKFGTIEVVKNIDARFKTLGVEPLSEALNYNDLKPKLNRERPIKNFLLDQQFIVGLGNIYVDESLFDAGILPMKPSHQLQKKEIENLIRSIKKILSLAIKNMGTTLSDYRTTQNIGGSNQFYLKVYGQSGKACSKCSMPILRIKMAGRSTHYCKNCQK